MKQEHLIYGGRGGAEDLEAEWKTRWAGIHNTGANQIILRAQDVVFENIATVIFIMPIEACIDGFLIFVNNDKNIDLKFEGANTCY